MISLLDCMATARADAARRRANRWRVAMLTLLSAWLLLAATFALANPPAPEADSRLLAADGA